MANNLLQKADECFENGDIEKALNFYLDELCTNKPSAELFMKIAHCNKFLGEDENAIEYYEKSLELNSENYETLLNYAEALMYVGRYDDAIEAIDKLILITKDSGLEVYEVAKSRKNQIESQKHNYIGGQLMKEQRYDEAKEEFLIAIDLFPNDRRNYANIGVIYLKNGDIDSAIIWIKKAIEVDENYVRGYYNLGTIFLQRGWYLQAINIFSKALEIEPSGRDSEDIKTNLENANQNYLILKEELINILNGKQIQIANDYVLELTNAIFPEPIYSVDFIIDKNNKRKIIAYTDKSRFEIYILENNFEFREIIE